MEGCIWRDCFVYQCFLSGKYHECLIKWMYIMRVLLGDVYLTKYFVFFDMIINFIKSNLNYDNCLSRGRSYFEIESKYNIKGGSLFYQEKTQTQSYTVPEICEFALCFRSDCLCGTRFDLNLSELGFLNEKKTSSGHLCKKLYTF